MLLDRINQILSSQENMAKVIQPQLVAVKIDRNRVADMWYKIIMEIAGNDRLNRILAQSVFDKVMNRVDQMTDEELEQQINRLVSMIDYVSLDIKKWCKK